MTKSATDTEGVVYVLEFSSGRLKVGFTSQPKTRLAHHATTAKAFGATVARTWLSAYHAEAKDNEKRLLVKCRSVVGVEAEGEYFAGVSWDEVVAFAESALIMTEIEPGQSTGDRRRATAREERARALDTFEERTEFTRRRAHEQLREAGIDPERVSPQAWMKDPQVASVLRRLGDGEAVDPQEIRDLFAGSDA